MYIQESIVDSMCVDVYDDADDDERNGMKTCFSWGGRLRCAGGRRRIAKCFAGRRWRGEGEGRIDLLALRRGKYFGLHRSGTLARSS